ncbi:hypothetical protein POM88_045549 [Heracleum sosnowskyi]|uniref:Uncharacterized protein n=1 Tax=Heracleum sosnowskyi TaxID=360622 RepID=A0AAD8H7P1_9APIA|nr:hypothetical protein POM88_045549 [Heracleum sosnowskyi]
MLAKCSIWGFVLGFSVIGLNPQKDDLVSGFLYDKLQKEKVDTLVRALEVESRKMKRKQQQEKIIQQQISSTNKRTVCEDISGGQENLRIRVINEVDDTPAPTDVLYP